jgi:hypothetical protein
LTLLAVVGLPPHRGAASQAPAPPLPLPLTLSPLLPPLPPLLAPSFADDADVSGKTQL